MEKAVNIQLVESLVNVIKALSPEEQELFKEKFQDHSSREITLERSETTQKAVSEHHQENSVKVDMSDFYQKIIEKKAKEKPSENDAWDILESLAGTVDAPEDWSSEHDHYLYGTPKQNITHEQ